MANDIVPLDQWQVPAANSWADSPVDPSTFTSGIGMAWPTLTIRGREWGWRFRGIEHAYTSPDPRAGGALRAVPHLDVVMVAAGNRISKVYYKGGYVKGDRAPPTCWSADGITPDAAASEKQSNTCGGCRHNAYGSKVGDSGQKGKACSDNKRIAVVTTDDLPNADFGGPFMFRLPPGSFKNYTAFCSVMSGRGFLPYQVVTRLEFESGEEYPKVTFKPLRPVNDDERAIVIAHQKNPRTNEMLNDKAMAAFIDAGADLDEAAVGELPPAAAPSSTSGWGGKVPPPGPTAVATAPEEPKPEPKPEPKLTPEQVEIAKLKAQLAAAEKEPEPEPKVVLTPEQLEIQALKAKLAEAEAAKGKRGRPRSKPVGPPTEVTAQSNGAEPVADPALGNNIADRVAAIRAGLVK